MLVTPVAAADPANGRVLAAQRSVCHGADGNTVNPVVPKLAGQNELYLIKALTDFSQGKRNDPSMSILAKRLSSQDMEDLAAWFTSIAVTVTVPK